MMNTWASGNLQEQSRTRKTKIDGVKIGRGSHVRLRPAQRADVVDLCLVGRTAQVDRIEECDDGRVHVVITLDDDTARDLGAMSQIGHQFFFTPAELEPLDRTVAESAPGTWILVAGLGDVFTVDGAFGAKVVERLRQRPVPRGVGLADYGIRTVDLAEALHDDFDAAVLVCAAPRGFEPGTVSVVHSEAVEGSTEAATSDLIKLLHRSGQSGTCRRALIVTCEPAVRKNTGMDELSETALHAVGEAVPLIERLVGQLREAQWSNKDGEL